MPTLPFRVTQTSLSTGANGFTATLFPDYAIRPFNIGIGCTVNSTALTYSVQHSFDYGSSTVISSNVSWFTNTAFSSIAGVQQDGNYAFPVSAIRLYVTATTSSSGTNTVTMTAIQAG